VPGKYQVKLTVDGQSCTQPFDVVRDENGAPQEVLESQFELLKLITDKVSETHEAVIQIRDLKEQLESWKKRLEKQQDAAGVVQAAVALKKKLTEIEDELIQRKAGSPLQFPTKLNAKMAALADAVDFADSAPTRQAREVFNELSGKINVQLSKLQDVLKSDVAAFNEMVREASIPVIGVK
jgi:uncharacterized coiled-coil DUF342 family protein